MRAPSEKTLRSVFRNLSASDARLIRKIAKAAADGEALRSVVEKSCPETAQYVRSMHSDPYNSRMRRTTVALDAINNVLGTHGVEGLGPTSGPSYAPPYEYLNTGDTYGTTLIYRRKTDTLSVGSWGDIVEQHPSWE